MEICYTGPVFIFFGVLYLDVLCGLLYNFSLGSSCPLVLDIIQNPKANSVEGCPFCSLKRYVIPAVDVAMWRLQGRRPGWGSAAAFLRPSLPPQCKGTAPSCGHLSRPLPHHNASSGGFRCAQTYPLQTTQSGRVTVQFSDLPYGF